MKKAIIASLITTVLMLLSIMLFASTDIKVSNWGYVWNPNGFATSIASDKVIGSDSYKQNIRATPQDATTPTAVIYAFMDKIDALKQWELASDTNNFAPPPPSPWYDYSAHPNNKVLSNLTLNATYRLNGSSLMARKNRMRQWNMSGKKNQLPYGNLTFYGSSKLDLFLQDIFGYPIEDDIDWSSNPNSIGKVWKVIPSLIPELSTGRARYQSGWLPVFNKFIKNNKSNAFAGISLFDATNTLDNISVTGIAWQYGWQPVVAYGGDMYEHPFGWLGEHIPINTDDYIGTAIYLDDVIAGIYDSATTGTVSYIAKDNYKLLNTNMVGTCNQVAALIDREYKPLALFPWYTNITETITSKTYSSVGSGTISYKVDFSGYPSTIQTLGCNVDIGTINETTVVSNNSRLAESTTFKARVSRLVGGAKIIVGFDVTKELASWNINESTPEVQLVLQLSQSGNRPEQILIKVGISDYGAGRFAAKIEGENITYPGHGYTLDTGFLTVPGGTYSDSFSVSSAGSFAYSVEFTDKIRSATDNFAMNSFLVAYPTDVQQELESFNDYIYFHYFKSYGYAEKDKYIPYSQAVRFNVLTNNYDGLYMHKLGSRLGMPELIPQQNRLEVMLLEDKCWEKLGANMKSNPLGYINVSKTDYRNMIEELTNFTARLNHAYDSEVVVTLTEEGMEPSSFLLYQSLQIAIDGGGYADWEGEKPAKAIDSHMASIEEILLKLPLLEIDTLN